MDSKAVQVFAIWVRRRFGHAVKRPPRFLYFTISLVVLAQPPPRTLDRSVKELRYPLALDGPHIEIHLCEAIGIAKGVPPSVKHFRHVPMRGLVASLVQVRD